MKKSYYNIGSMGCIFMVTALCGTIKAQTRTISGTVTSQGKPLSGVTVSQEGSDQVTMSGSNGTYTLQVSAENPTLWFRNRRSYSQRRLLQGKRQRKNR